ncbi:hypothetical protein SUGI_0699120 [Cryptomeria japonica]|nr:hypothetical protein SUGI_0699120 [Cryptomeria japonica]
MKTGIAFIVSISFLSCVILLCEARAIKVPNPAVLIPSPSLAPIISVVFAANRRETASYKDLRRKGYSGHPGSKNIKYGSYKTNENDVATAPPTMSHQDGHSPGVGHSNPYSLCC